MRRLLYTQHFQHRDQYLSGTWSSEHDLTTEAVRTYYSQNAYDLPLGSNGIYMGDRWRSSLLGSSRYIWFPLDFSSGSPTIVHADVWDLDVAAGLYLDLGLSAGI